MLAVVCLSDISNYQLIIKTGPGGWSLVQAPGDTEPLARLDTVTGEEFRPQSVATAVHHDFGTEHQVTAGFLRGLILPPLCTSTRRGCWPSERPAHRGAKAL